MCLHFPIFFFNEKIKIYCLVSAKERNNKYCLINNQLWLACHTWCRNQVSKNNKRVEIQSINAENHFSMIDMLSMWYDWHVDRPWQWPCMVSLPPVNGSCKASHILLFTLWLSHSLEGLLFWIILDLVLKVVS